MKAKRIERTLEVIDEEALQSQLLNLLQDVLLDEDEITEESLANLATLIVTSTISDIKEQLMAAKEAEETAVEFVKNRQREKQKEVNSYKVDPHTGQHSEKYKQRSDAIYHVVNDKDVY